MLRFPGLSWGQTILQAVTRALRLSVILLLLILIPASLWSAPVTWYLKDVALTGGGSLTGSLTYDHDTGVLSSWSIQSSPGAPSISCPPNGCTWTSSTDANTVFGIGVVADTPTFTSFALGTIDGESLLIALAGQLTDAGGTVPMVGPAADGCHEGNAANPGCVLNGNGPSGADLTGWLTTASTVPIVGSTALPNGTVGISYSQSLTASGGTPPYSNWSISSGTLPPGLALNTSTGLIGGVPAASGTYSFSVTIEDSTGAISAPQSFSVTIWAANIIVNQAGATNPTSDGFTLNVGGGVTSQGPVGNAWNVQGTWCCAGDWHYLTDSQITILSKATNWAFIVTYQNLSSDTGPGYFGWPDGYGSVAYLQINGLRFDLDLHSDGHGNQVLSLDPITGSPVYTIAGLGTNYVTLELLYNNTTMTASVFVNGEEVISNYPGHAPVAGYTENAVVFGGENANFSLVELEAGTPTLPVVESAALPNGIVGSSYTQSMTASGGTPPYGSWTVSSGTLPAGLTLNTSTGLVSGVPTAAGNYTFSVTVQDLTGAISMPQSFSVVVSAASGPQISSISTLSTAQNQNIVITGSGFGTHAGYTGDSSSILFVDETSGWSGGFAGTFQGSGVDDLVTLVVNSWTDSQIVLGGFAGAWGSGNWTLHAGDQIKVYVWNAQTGAGPAMIATSVPTQSAASSGQLYVSLMTDNGDQLGSVIATASISGFGTFPSIQSATLVSQPALTAGMKYWVVVAAPDPVNDFLGWDRVSTGSGSPQALNAQAIGSGPWSIYPGYEGTLQIIGTDGTILFDDFPPGDAYDMTSSWTIGGGAASGNAGYTQGLQFTPAVSGTAQSIAVAAFSKSSSVPGSPAVATTSLSNGTVGVSYSESLSASGGTPPYSNWSVSSGTLPAGLTLNSSTGAISGAPTAAGTFNFSVTVLDSLGAVSPARNLSITIVQAATKMLSVMPAALHFQAQQNASVQSQSLQIGGTAGTMWQATAMTSSGGGWLSLAPASGMTPSSLTVTINPAGLAPGAYQGGISIQAPAAAPASIQIDVTLIISAVGGPAGTITTVAGGGAFVFPASVTALNAPLGNVAGVAVDSNDNIYVADPTNDRVFLVGADGSIRIVAGNGSAGSYGDGGQATSAALNGPYGVALDASGNLFIVDSFNRRIRKVSPDGIISTVAGGGSGGDGGPATLASLNQPSGVAVDSSGNLYIADAGSNRIRKVSSSGIISTVAGNGSAGFSGDGGLATAATLSGPAGVAVDSSGNLFIADFYNSRIRKVSTGGIITTVAGGTVECLEVTFSGPATSAPLCDPVGVAVDASGNLFIADPDIWQILKVSAASGTISSVAGSFSYGFSGDGGQATLASLNYPGGVAVDNSGNIFIADTLDERIRKVSVGGIISTVAGNENFGFSGDGGPATSASLNSPQGAFVDSLGNLFVADFANNRIREVSPGGDITTVAGDGTSGFSGDRGPATQAWIFNPSSVAVDSAGDVFIADTNNHRIREVSGGTIATIAGNGVQSFSGDGGPAISAELWGPVAIALDSSGDLFIADNYNNRIRKVSPNGIITTVAGSGNPGASGNQGFAGDGGPATAARLNYPNGVAVDASGNLFIADSSNNRIRKVSSSGIITTVAGNGTAGFSGDGGPATAAELSLPLSVAVDASGNIFIADRGNNRIRMVSASGTITTVAGSGNYGFYGDGGPATAAWLYGASGVAVDAFGNLFIADAGNNRIREVFNASGVPTGLKVTSVGNGASFSQAFAPGMLMSVFGTGLSTGNPQTVTTAPLPLTSASGTYVTISGFAAPLLYVSSTQINLQIPYGVSPGNATLVVNSGGQSASISFTIQAAAPGIFVDSQNGHIVPNESATAGSTIGFFVTGAGQVTPAEETGNVPAQGTTPVPDLPLSMKVGGIAVTPVYVGIPSWSVGVLQINFTVPSTLAAGTYPVVVTIGGVASQTALLTVTSP